MKHLVILLVFLSLFSCENTPKYSSLKGTAFGTSFSIKYKNTAHQDFTNTVDSLVNSVNKSLSTYMQTSDISRINQGDTTVVIDEKFIEVYKKSKRIFVETNGVFDPTIGVLVNAWDFGPEKQIKNLDSLTVRKLMQQVGFDKVHLQNNKIVKENNKTYFDFNAIAKGYGIDIIGRFFETKGITNYMVEIGGEVRAKGKNQNDEFWRIGIEHPNFDGTQSIQKVISLRNESIATSGTYRKFKIDKNGNKYAHILNTKTGYPAKSNLLSASVIAPLDCADVDGYATTFIAFGLEKSKEFLKNHQELKAFLIYVDGDGKMQTYQSENLE